MKQEKEICFYRFILAMFDNGAYVIPAVGFWIMDKNGETKFYVPIQRKTHDVEHVVKWEYLDDIYPDFKEFQNTEKGN